MSYLKLDQTSINYTTSLGTSNLFVSEIIDSDCSYVTPKVITSSEELDIYFGKSFTQREYYEELLQSGVSLLLYRPIKENLGLEELDLSEYKEILDFDTMPLREKKYEYIDELPSDGIPEYYSPGKYKFYVTTEESYYIWYEGDYIKASDFPSDDYSSSLVNRDTLRLLDYALGSKSFKYCHPKYRSRSYNPTYTEDLTGITESLLQSIESHGGIGDDCRTVAYTLDFTGVKNFGETDYIVFPLSSDSRHSRVQFYFGSQPPLEADIISGAESKQILGDTKEDKIKNIISELKENYGFKVIEYSKTKYVIYTSDLLQDLQFFSLEGLVYEKNETISQNIYSILSDEHKRLEVFSRTIGPGDSDIKFKIEKLSGDFKEHYRITISRYTYTEVFEGSLYIEYDESTGTFSSLETVINQESDLVEIKIYNQGRSIDNSEDGLIPGEYELKRAISEKSYTPADYWRALSKLQEFNLSEDFLLVPEIEKYEIIGASSDTSWISEYTTLLGYAEEKNCQVLFSNHSWKFGCTRLEMLQEDPEKPEEEVMYGIAKDQDTIIYKSYSSDAGWTIYNFDDKHKYRVHEIEEIFSPGYTGNHIFNYTKDTSNRLVYFYQDMTFYGNSRPAYYMFLKGIISGKYSETSDTIDYKSPVNSYEEDKSNLQTWKSNFLSFNDHIYYYRNFFNHTGDWNYKTSILTRFCMDKVTNTVMREFPQYLGSETIGELRSGLQSILTSLIQNFPIIYSLSIGSITENSENQSILVYLILEIKELLEKDIKLSVTLNFNNT